MDAIVIETIRRMRDRAHRNGNAAAAANYDAAMAAQRRLALLRAKGGNHAQG